MRLTWRALWMRLGGESHPSRFGLVVAGWVEGEFGE